MAAQEPPAPSSDDSGPSRDALEMGAPPVVTVEFVESSDAFWRRQTDADREASGVAREVTPGSAAARSFEVAAAPLSAIISEHPDNFAGLHFNWHVGRVDVHVVDVDGPGMAEVHQLMRDKGDEYFHLVVVPVSERLLLSAQNRLVDEMDGRLKNMGLNEVSSDWRRGRLRAVLDSGCAERIAGTTRIRSLSTGSDVDLQSIASGIGVGIDVAIERWVPVLATSLDPEAATTER